MDRRRELGPELYVVWFPARRPALISPVGVTSDGSARICATLFSEMRNAVFARVGQHAVRSIARKTFEHLLDLDLRFHLTRQTGGLTRAIDRGTK